MAKSSNGGRDFAEERVIYGAKTGVCGCCGSRALAGLDGTLYVLFRSATQMVHRDIWFLSSADKGVTFEGADISPWNIGACVMSTAALLSTSGGLLAAWESEKQVYFGRLPPGSGSMGFSVGAPLASTDSSPEKDNRKYPALAGLTRPGFVRLDGAHGMEERRLGRLADLRFEFAAGGSGRNSRRRSGLGDTGSICTPPDGSFVVMF